MKTISIIGSTGSIGKQALEIIASRPQEFQVVALSAGKNFDLLLKQIDYFKPQYASILNPEQRTKLKEIFPTLEILDSNNELAKLPVDIFLSAIVGIAGLEANLTALKHARRVAIANKETLVSAPHLVRAAQQQYNSELIPIDSEHVAIHQCLQGSKKSEVQEILLTSSGGPFRTWSAAQIQNATLKDALKHPTWNMGAKITIDSSTLMNKGLEVIEAHALFDINYEQIKVIIHPQSIIHSAVSFIDGNTLAQLSNPDMRVPIQYSLDFPSKHTNTISKPLNLTQIAKLEFYEPDLAKFPALKLAYQAGKDAASYPTVLNSANEAAVALFMQEAIHYQDIVRIIEDELNSHKAIPEPSLEDILVIDQSIKTRYVTTQLSS